MIWQQYDEKNYASIFRQVVEAIMVIGHSIELCLRIWDQYDLTIDPVVKSTIGKFEKHHELLLNLELKIKKPG